MTDKSVAFVGLGYIGLPTAVVLANSGVNVVGIDVKQDVVDALNDGKVTIVEPGLQEGLNEAIKSGRFKATTEMVHADSYIIAVPTPFTANHDIDMKYIYSAAENIAPQLRGDELIVLESTSPPGTTERMAARILELRPDLVADGTENTENKPVLYFAHCPERILPGYAMEELITNDRIIGGQTPEATRRATAVYASFCKGELLPTDDKTAEMAKLTENSFRDVNIAFANELSLICDELDINVWELIKLANHHPRVNILQPGPGVGGHCIAVDPWFIVAAAPETSQLIRTAREINDGKPGWVLDKIAQAKQEKPGAEIALLGMAFKANIDDLRESPAIDIARKAAGRFSSSHITISEPNVSQMPTALKEFDNMTFKQSVDEAIESADIVVLLVDHDEYETVTAHQLAGKTVIDTKGFWR